MNQILSTEDINNKYKKGRTNSKDVNKTIKFFAIVLIIFGVFLIASSSYALYKGGNNSDTKNNSNGAKPEIDVEVKDDKQLILTVMHQEEISQVVYYWNDDYPETVMGMGRKYIQTKINIPAGKNTLTVRATDVNGQVSEYSEEHELKSAITIQMEKSGNKVKVTVTGNDKIKAIAYKWDEETPKRIDVNNTKHSFEVNVSLGEHQLIVQAVDVNNNKEQKKMTVTGATTPTVNLAPGNNSYVVTAHDDIALDRVEIETLADGKVTTIKADGKDFEYNFPLKQNDDNKIKVTAYNSNGVSSKSKKALWKK